MAEQRAAVAGWYPDTDRASFRWWNGSEYTNQGWRPSSDGQLYDVMLVSLGSAWATPLRGNLMRLLGLSRAHSKALVSQVPCVIATNLPRQAADQVLEQLERDGAEAEVRPARSISAALSGAATAAAPVAAPVSSPAAPVAAPVPAPVAPSPAVPSPAPGSPGLDPRFAQIESYYAQYRAQLQAGTITPEQLEGALAALVFESGGRHWTIGASTGQWYASSGGSWVAATPGS